MACCPLAFKYFRLLHAAFYREFPCDFLWQTYVDSRRLEITCGEAPYLTTRYDVETGELIPVFKIMSVIISIFNLHEKISQLTFYDLLNLEERIQVMAQTQPRCIIYNWRAREPKEFTTIKAGEKRMKFDFIIGNPPYQDETESDSTRMPPIYNLFMEESYKISDKVELITPARFLFDAGYTPKSWNQKMLADEHFKVLYYEAKSGNIFSNTDIKGGIAISYRDVTRDFEAIGTFTIYPELNSILQKVLTTSANFLNSICYPALSYGLTPLMQQEHPDTVGRLRTSAFTKLEEIFFDEKPNDGHEYIQMIGLLGTKRAIKFVRKDYIKTPDNFEHYKIILPASNGSGAIGEVLSTPLIGQPLIGHTQTFISIGNFEHEEEANAALKYVKSKFARTLLGVLKITQHNPPEKWKYVPLQDFTVNSDIDWSQSVEGIDRQLYAKYGLDDNEIAFIESHVKEMK